MGCAGEAAVETGNAGTAGETTRACNTAENMQRISQVSSKALFFFTSHLVPVSLLVPLD